MRRPGAGGLSDETGQYCADFKALSAKQEETAAAVERQKAELAAMKEKCAAIQGELTMLGQRRFRLQRAASVWWRRIWDAKAMRTPGQSADGEGRPVAAVFAGNDRDGYRYIIGSKQVDLRALSKELNVVLNGRGRRICCHDPGQRTDRRDNDQEYINGI